METTALEKRSSGSTALVMPSLGEMIAFAEWMAKAVTIPSHLQGKAADCLAVVEQAYRWQMSPFAVAQCTSLINGKLMYEGKLVAAVINSRGELAQRLNYEYSGQGRERTVTVSGVLRGETKPREVTVKLADAETKNAVWQKQPDQQLMYHGARVWARRHMPELMLGVYSPEEFDQATGTQSAAPTNVVMDAEVVEGPTAPEPEPKCTPPQQKRFFQLARPLIGEEDAIKAWLRNRTGTDATKELTKSGMAALITELEAEDKRRSDEVTQ